MKLINLKQFIILSRPVLFPLLILCLFMALFYSANIYTINIFHIIEILLLTFLTPFLIFAINDVYDYESDKTNSRKKDIIQGMTFKNIRSLKKAINFYNIIITLILLLYSLVFLNPVTTLLIALLLFFNYFYSVPPIRFKEIPFLDSISNGVIVLLYFAIVYSLFNPILSLLFDIIAVGISIMSYHLIAAQIDVDSDRKGGQRTTATFINNRTITYLVCVIYNLPLLFINFGLIFSYLFYFNIIIIIYIYLKNEFNKKRLLTIFLLGWVIITISYIIQKIIL